MRIGIDKIGFYTPHLYVEMDQLAQARQDDPAKYKMGIGQDRMAVSPLSQDVVTLGANAALQILEPEDYEKIDFVIVGTESGMDASKSAAAYIHDILGIQPYARVIEMKQACYGATAGLQLARGHIALHPGSRVLVIGSDIARYGLASGGEVTQGAGAVAMLVTADPRILEIEAEDAFYSKDIMDFWRPMYSEVAMVDGKFSSDQYIEFFLRTWEQYKAVSGRSLEDIKAFCFHLPFTKMGMKAFREILPEASEAKQAELTEFYRLSTLYNRNVGNIYTGSLFLSFLSLLENTDQLQAGDRIALYSYGSGAVGEIFTGLLVDGYRDHLVKAKHDQVFAQRKEISVAEYEDLFNQGYVKDGSEQIIEKKDDPAKIVVKGIRDHQRIYTYVTQPSVVNP